MSEITDNGPNSGLWYISGSDFHITRGSNLNKHVFPSGMRFALSVQNAQDCGGILNASDANWHEMNATCKGLPVADLIAAAWAHEGFGGGAPNGTGAGHQAYGEAAAAVHDPRREVEPLFASTQELLRDQVELVYGILDNAIDMASDQVDHVRGNYPASSWWTWDNNNYEYVLYTWSSF